MTFTPNTWHARRQARLTSDEQLHWVNVGQIIKEMSGADLLRVIPDYREIRFQAFLPNEHGAQWGFQITVCVHHYTCRRHDPFTPPEIVKQANELARQMHDAFLLLI